MLSFSPTGDTTGDTMGTLSLRPVAALRTEFVPYTEGNAEVLNIPSATHDRISSISKPLSPLCSDKGATNPFPTSPCCCPCPIPRL